MARRAGVPEWPKGAGCKPAGSAFGGSNPPPCTAVKFSFEIGKRFGLGRLPPEQEVVLQRLEKGEITAEEAEQELGGSVRVFEFSTGGDGEEPPKPAVGDAPAASAEDEMARQMIEEIAREVDEETRG